jgi:ribosomal protein L7/L12
MRYKLVLVEAGDNILGLFDAIKGDAGLGDVQQDTLLDLLPMDVMNDISEAEARRYRSELQAMGAVVEIHEIQ